MSYLATYKPGFLKDAAKLPNDVKKRFLIAVEHIRQDPFAVSARKLVGHAQLYRYRLGDYRLVYYVDRELNKVIFLLIAHRKDIYRHLKKSAR